MRKHYLTLAFGALCLGAAAQDAPLPDEMEQENIMVQRAVENIANAITIVNSSWSKSVRGTDSNTYVADSFSFSTGLASGASDVWPYTAAIEGHCALLEALAELRSVDAEAYEANFPGTIDTYIGRLERLIDNLEYYRGTYTLVSYTGSSTWSPYAVPRASERGKANVTGILNVYDDQMWLCRELVRAYRLTGNNDYRDLAAYLADYVIDGWDCWRDANGKEYGGITWGPGYNSKHACSNAPIIQPLVWLSDIYKDSDETMRFGYRTETNSVVREYRPRTEVYLEMAKKVYDWQFEKLRTSSGVYWDMMGADNTIQVSRGQRQHVDCGNPVGNYYSYNTGTMISGAAELYRVTGEQRYLTEMEQSVDGAFREFHKYTRKHLIYEMKTDETAASGFNTWFNNVLFRSYIDADLYLPASNSLSRVFAGQQYCLDYAMANHQKREQLPIKLIDGWGDDNMTKAFHQFSFASEMSLLAVKNLRDATLNGIHDVVADSNIDADAISDDAPVYSLSGVCLGRYGSVKSKLLPGIYVCAGRKLAVR